MSTKEENQSSEGQSKTLILKIVDKIPANEGSENALEVTNIAREISVAEHETTFSTTILNNLTTPAEIIPNTEQVTVDSKEMNVGILDGYAVRKTLRET